MWTLKKVWKIWRFTIAIKYKFIKILWFLVNLVERSPELPILDLQRISKRDPNDLVELATQIQFAEIGVKNSACNKLSIIAEQVFDAQL